MKYGLPKPDYINDRSGDSHGETIRAVIWAAVVVVIFCIAATLTKIGVPA